MDGSWRLDVGSHTHKAQQGDSDAAGVASNHFIGENLVESANTKELLLISLDPLPACHGAAPAPAYRVSNRGIVPFTHRGLANRGRSVCLLADSTSLPADPKSIACSSRKSLGLF